MKKLLVIQFRNNGHCDVERNNFLRVARQDGSFTLTFLNALENQIDWQNPQEIIADYDGIILGGSSDLYLAHPEKGNREMLKRALTNATPLIEHAIAHDYPLLGVCFGHHLIGKHLGVNIVLDEDQSKIGSHDLTISPICESDPIFDNVPAIFTAQYGHKETIETLPEGCSLLANGPKCKLGAIKYKNNIYGVQFHPEMELEDVNARAGMFEDYRKIDPEFDKKLKPSPHASNVVKNFARHAKGGEGRVV